MTTKTEKHTEEKSGTLFHRVRVLVFENYILDELAGLNA
jgi:hypothetical protein